MRAITADIYTNKQYSTCSNNGVSSQFTEILIPHPRGNLEMTGEEPNACKIVKRYLFGKVVYHVAPYKSDDSQWYMFGGAYVSGDSRFTELVGQQYGAIALHDRIEAWVE